MIPYHRELGLYLVHSENQKTETTNVISSQAKSLTREQELSAAPVELNVLTVGDTLSLMQLPDITHSADVMDECRSDTRHSLLRISGWIGNPSVQVTFLHDTGVSHSFIDDRFVERQGWQNKIRRGQDQVVSLANGSTTINRGYIDLHYGQGDYQVKARFEITRLSDKNEVVLGKPWWHEFDPDVDWKKDMLRFDREVARLNSKSIHI